jgi:PD-(D/E)XK nuclease superfamily
MSLLDLVDDVIAEQDFILRSGHTTTLLPLPPNLAFSAELPTLQIAYDATSTSAAKTCARYYYYSVVLGIVPFNESVHLKAGKIYHGALELFERERFAGKSHDAATLSAMRYVILETWDYELNRPWTHSLPHKSREALLRAVVWYVDHFYNEPFETIVLDNGQLGVEVPFRFDLDISTISTNESILLCGYLDKLARNTHTNHPWIFDLKTTKAQPGQNYFDRYTLDNQMSQYDVAGTMVYHEPFAGIVIDLVELQITGAKFSRGEVERKTHRQREEWLRELQYYIRVIEGWAVRNDWPRNDRACMMYSSYNSDLETWVGGCPYRVPCGASGRLRDQLLESMFTPRTWDPLQPR